MKKLLLMIFVAIVTLPAFSADTLTVALDEFNECRTLKQAIEDNAGAKIIKLQRGGFYFCDAVVDLTANTVIVGEKGTATIAPPILIMQTQADGTSFSRMFTAKANLTLKNLYLPGVDEGGTYINFYFTEAENIRLEVDNCVLNYTNDWKGFFEFRGTNNSAFMTNNIIMNMMRADGYVWATFFHTQGTKHDSLVFTNNTIFNAPNNFMSLNEKEYISPDFALFEHNTIVNTAKDVIHFSYFMNAYRKNNLIVNCIYQGDAEKSMAGWTDRVQCPDLEPYAFVKVDTIPNSTWVDSAAAAIGVPHRTFEVTNNNYFQSDAVKAIPTAFNTDTTLGHVAGVLSPRSKAMFDNDTDWPGLKFENNTELDPGFTKDPTVVADLLAHATMLYNNGEGVNIHVDADKATNPTAYQMTYEWPINIFDFTYSNTTLATASDLGYHVGDLYHWYPAEYAKWKKGIMASTDDFASYLEKTISVYPNPATSDIITLSKVADVTIFNINGQEVMTSANTDKINISKLVNGMYFVKTTEGHIAKFIIK